MIAFLLLVTIIMGALLFETRHRLARLEQLFPEGSVSPVDDAGWSDAAPSPDMDVGTPAETTPIAQITEIGPVAVEPAPPLQFDMPSIASEPAEPVTVAASSGFEDLFGRKLPIWAGGITLVVAAVLLVKYSIDAGLLSPGVRVVLGLLFGVALIGGAEAARRRADFVRDDRIAQALAGAGVGSLYAATLAATNLYALIGPGMAFAGLSAITALAMGLALRFGAPTAVLGLVGGLATPALVNSGEANVPLLAGYLALVIGGLTLLSRRQRWFWLGVSALAGGGAWTALLIAFSRLNQVSGLSVGLLVLMIGLGLPMVASADRRGPMLQAIAAVVASLQLALLVATGGYAVLSWGLYGLLAIAFIWLTTRMPNLRATVAVPLLTSLLLAAIWPAPPFHLFVAVMAGIMVIFSGSALWRLWRADGRLVDAGQLVVTALGGFLVSYWQYHSALPGEDMRFALIALLFAAFPIAGTAVGWRRTDWQEDLRFAMLVLSAGLLVFIAAILGLPAWTIPISGALVAGALLAVGEAARDHSVRLGALAYLGAALAFLLVTGAQSEVARLAMAVAAEPSAQVLLRWATMLAVTAIFAWRFAGSPIGTAGEAVAAVLAYGLIAQILPAAWLAIAAALGILIATEATRRAPRLNLRAAPTMLAAIVALWALEPLGRWLMAGAASLVGEPVFVHELTSWPLAFQRLLGPALIGAVVLWRMRERLPRPAGLFAMAQIGAIGLIGCHILYKQLFAIDDMDAFVRFGLAERTLWEVLLIGVGVALWRFAPDRKTALVLVALGLAHNLYYSLFLHNPLWAEQAVGTWPLGNLLLPAFVIAFAGPTVLERIAPVLKRRLQQPVAILRMIVILLLSLASLRQLFSGRILVGTPVEPTENILWSVVAIALAVGYLIWGIHSGQRAWRVGSLALMLAAVAKVFLLDAAGLEGLLRIASFLALGFSLIGIGWLYSRYLKTDAA